MPWNHCQASEIADTNPCPECGVDKNAWTIEVEVTRTFKVSRPPSLRVTLFDDLEEGVGHEPYHVELPDGRVIEGHLDERGFARIVHAQQGECTITFPARAPEGVIPYAEDAEDADDADDAAEDEDPAAEDPAAEDPAADDSGEDEGEAEPQPPSFQREAIGRHRFELNRVLQLTLLDERRGRPLRNAEYSLEDEEGNRYEGTTDGRGRLDHGSVRGRWFNLSVSVEIDPPRAVWLGDEARYESYGHTVGATEPETLSATQRAPAVLLQDAFQLVPVLGIPVIRSDRGGRRFVIQLLDPKDQPVPGEPYEVELEDGEVVSGELGEDGTATHEFPANQTCVVTFPCLHEGEVELRDAQVGDEDAEGEAEDDADETESSEDDTTEPSGTEHRVVHGDTLTSLARDHDLPGWRAIYFHPRNTGLRKVRKDPNRLCPGDTLWIPEPEPEPTESESDGSDDSEETPHVQFAAQFDCASREEHVFHLCWPECESSDEPAGGSEGWVKLRLRDEHHEPVADEPYVVEWTDGTIVKGRLDGQGEARTKGRGHTTCRVLFPERHTLDVLCASPHAHLPHEADRGEEHELEGPHEEEHRAWFEVEEGHEHEFELVGHFCSPEDEDWDPDEDDDAEDEEGS